MDGRRPGGGSRLAMALVVAWIAISMAIGSTAVADQVPGATSVSITGGASPR
jgi:hypothetical protein